MIRMIQSTSAGQAKKYFSGELSISDYYVNDQELQGRFNGKLADRLQITGPATKQAFFNLCENINPVTGKSLTARTNEKRTVGYDINFHCPKSVSILHILAKNDHIREAFEACVSDTMRDIEADSKTTVRKSKATGHRQTGELAWAEFTHQTARPLDGEMPDPHLHAHCFVFNATWDEEEKQFKAAQFRDIKKDMPYYQARFHKRLADRLEGLGYQIKRTESAFEVAVVPQWAIDHFSKRTDEIGRIAQEKGITDAKQLDGLGARTRSKKLKGLTMADLKAEWKEQLQRINTEKKSEGSGKVRIGAGREKIGPKQCLDHVFNHCFERASVVDNRRALAEAYRHALGHGETSFEEIDQQFLEDERLLHFKQGSRTLSTTKDVLLEERHMVKLAMAGIGQLAPIYKEVPNLSLDGQQAAAARYLLTTRDRVSLVQGRAGVGKTTMMKETVSLIKAAGKQVIVVAPSAEASRGVLRSEGFKDAETVAKFLGDQEAHKKLAGQVLLVDEAGLLGTKDMTSLLELVTKHDARLILSGDTRQHSAVVRGDALRVLNTVGGIRGAEVTKIRRQKKEDYREAVEHLANGNVKQAFAKLDAMHAIKAIDPMIPHKELVNDYVAVLKKRKTALIIAPTHKQGDAVTAAVRAELREAGMIGKTEISATRLFNRNLTEAEKADWRNYREGQVVQFNQHLPGIRRGEAWTIKEIAESKIEIESADGKTAYLSCNKGRQFDVFEKSVIGISKGDKIKITRNGFDLHKRRLNNGATLEVTGISKQGKITLRQPTSKATYELGADFGHVAHGHCITSHASQGKTVDAVFISQPAATFPATDLKQFYVSASRGQQEISIYTDDKDELLAHASALGNRVSALELAGLGHTHQEYVDLKQRSANDRSAPAETKQHNFSLNKSIIERDHEPSL